MSDLRVSRLRTESLEDPCGIERELPRFSWIVESDQIGARQSAYQIEVFDGEALLWDSGKVPSDATHHIAYAGPALAELHAYTWRVRVWDAQDALSADSETAQFVTAFKPGSHLAGGMDFLSDSCPTSVTLFPNRLYARKRSGHCLRGIHRKRYL